MLLYDLSSYELGYKNNLNLTFYIDSAVWLYFSGYLVYSISYRALMYLVDISAELKFIGSLATFFVLTF